MALAVSLRRVLLMLLTMTVFILMVLYWNQAGIKPQSFMGTFERPMRKRESSHRHGVLDIPVEKMWTYKCEKDRCVRNHYFESDKHAEKRIPFMTCTMTCGAINIWPHPTIKTAISSSSLRFSVEDVQLRIDTPHSAVEARFKQVFELFLANLETIQRLSPNRGDIHSHVDESSPAEKTLNEGRARRETPAAEVKEQRHMRRHVDIGKETNNDEGSNVATGGLLTNMFSLRRRCDVDTLLVQVQVHKSGDMNLNFDTDESYKLNVSHEGRTVHAVIAANSYFGARHGMSTLQQLIWYDDEENLLRILSKAIIIDTPKFRYRGLMLDTSRHYFSVASIKRTIAAMALTKLNRFHWHITDSQSFPYVSKYYPELAAYGAYSDREVYTDEDIREVTTFAQLHGVQVIPEIDAPAHAGNGWEWGSQRGLGELSLCINQQPWSLFCGEPPCGQLNPKNNNTYLILQRLYEELLNLTGPTDFFHLGGDEVNLDCWAQFFNDTDLRGMWCDFMLNALARLKIANQNVEPRIVAVWSSGLTNTKCLSNSRFAVQMWGGSTWTENYDLIENGFNVIFSHVDAWYLDCGFGNWRSTGEGACSPYRTWQNVYKHRPWTRMHLNNLQQKQVLGGEVCLWTEQVDENQLDNRLWPRSAALGERLWSDPNDEQDYDVVPTEVFQRMSVFRNRLVELGLEAEPIFPKFCAQNPGECI